MLCHKPLLSQTLVMGGKMTGEEGERGNAKSGTAAVGQSGERRGERCSKKQSAVIFERFRLLVFFRYYLTTTENTFI